MFVPRWSSETRSRRVSTFDRSGAANEGQPLLHLRVAPANALVTDKAPGRVRTDLGARTSAGGGSKSNGTVFELPPLSGGGWSETVIHDFMGWPSDGIQTTGVKSTKSRGAIEVHKPRGPQNGRRLARQGR